MQFFMFSGQVLDIQPQNLGPVKRSGDIFSRDILKIGAVFIHQQIEGRQPFRFGQRAGDRSERHHAPVLGSEPFRNDPGMPDDAETRPIVRPDALQFVPFGRAMKIDAFSRQRIADRDSVTVTVRSAQRQKTVFASGQQFPGPPVVPNTVFSSDFSKQSSHKSDI